MRNGIVYMQQVEVMVNDYIHHGTGQSHFIGRIIKQWVGGYPYFVIKNIGIENI